MRAKTSTALVFAVALSVAAALAYTERTGQSVSLPFGTWTRASDAPIISPQGTTWESAGAFNPAVVLHNGKIVMLYRAQDAAGTSRLGYAESTDGIQDRKSTRLNSSHSQISYAVFCLKKKKKYKRYRSVRPVSHDRTMYTTDYM